MNFELEYLTLPTGDKTASSGNVVAKVDGDIHAA